MMTHFRAAVFFAAAALVLAMPVAAQNATEELGPLESNTYKATSGLFGNDVDNFVDVHSYSEVNPENWFGFLTGRPLHIGGQESIGWLKPEGVTFRDPDDPLKGYNKPTGFLSENPTTGLLSLGYARQISSIYLGLWYQGNIVQITGGTGNKTKTTSISADYDAYKTLTETKEETTWNESWLNTSNQIEILVGVAGQGIKLGFYESLFSNIHKGATWRLNGTDDGHHGQAKVRNSDGDIIAPVIRKTDHQNGIVDYQNVTDEFYTKGGYLRPYLGWGSTFNLAGIGLRPYVNLGLTIKNDKKVDNWSNYTEVNGSKYNEISNVDSGYDFSYMKPEVGVGAWFDFAAEGGKTIATTVGIEYDLDLYIYGSSYEATGFAGDKVKGNVSWSGIWPSDDDRVPAYVNRTTTYLDRTVTTTDIQLSIDEISELRHEIIPTYIISGDPVENLSLGFKASVPVGIRTYASEQHTERHEITNTEYNTDSRNNSYTTTITTNGFQSMEEKNIGIALDLAIGASYKLIPDRFSINAGVSARPLAFTNTVRTYKAPSNREIITTKTTDGLGNVTTDTKQVRFYGDPSFGWEEDWLVQKDQVEENTTWDAFSGNITGGFTFFFTQNVALDMAARWGKDSFNVNIADVNVLLSFKF